MVVLPVEPTANGSVVADLFLLPFFLCLLALLCVIELKMLK